MAGPNYEEKLDAHELKQRLIAELEASRADLRQSQARLRQRLDLKSQAQRIVQKYPVAVTTAALGGGVALAASLTGSKKSGHKPKKKKGLSRTGIGFATGLVVKPMLKKWASNQVNALVSGRPSR